MAGMFSVGETKVRPGVYYRYENVGASETAQSINGIGAVVIKSNWGPLGQVVSADGENAVIAAFGAGGASDTVDAALEMIRGGCSSVKIVRAGTGGTETAITLKDTTVAEPISVVTLTAKHKGNRAFSVTIRDSLMNSNLRECIIMDGTTEFEKVEFAKGAAGDGEPAALTAAFAGSKNFTATKLVDGNKVMAAAAQSSMTPGTNPTVSAAEYSAAFTVLEAAQWNVLCVDTVDTAVHALVKPYVQRLYSAGYFPMAVVAEAAATALATRMDSAAAFNDEKIHYVLNGWVGPDNTTYNGYKAAARIGGMIAAVQANQSLTHKTINGAVAVSEGLTNTQIETALSKGCICVTAGASGNVWIESGINTLISPSGNQDAGWKKIRRVKTRFELMQRIVAGTDALIGRVNNDTDGRAAIVAAGQGVVNAMIAEGKLLSGGTFAEDAVQSPIGDSAWFVIAVDDNDSVERGYMTFKYRFSPES